MEVGKTYIFVKNDGKTENDFIKGKILSFSLRWHILVFTEGKTINLFTDDTIRVYKDEAHVLSAHLKDTSLEWILFHCIETLKQPLSLALPINGSTDKHLLVDKLPFAKYIANQCNLSFIYHHEGKTFTALEHAILQVAGHMIQFLFKKNAPFMNKEILKTCMIRYSIPLRMYNVSMVTDMSYLFHQIKIEDVDKNVDISQWDVSNVKNMRELFKNSNFDGDISQWDVSRVEDMTDLFMGSEFDGDISQWDVSNVLDMTGMFFDSLFNGDISQWNVSNVIQMRYLFGESNFNGDISQWNVTNVMDMSGMFYSSLFNGDISQWNVSNVKRMKGMFRSSIFNRDLLNWNVCKVKDMSEMFLNSLFNSDISTWNTYGKKVDTMFDNCPISVMHRPQTTPSLSCKKIGAGTRKKR